MDGADARGNDRLEPDDLQEIVVACDRDGIILSWNRAGEEITGFLHDDVIGYHLDAVIAPESRQFLDQILTVERSGSLLPGSPCACRRASAGWCRRR